MQQDGSPFYWNCDTGWGIFQFISKEDAQRYLEDRKAKGFNGFLGSMVFHFGNEPNFYGQKAWTNDNPLKPNEAYYKNVDEVINKAVEMDLYIGLLPFWGDKVAGSEQVNMRNAYAYGWFLGNRYRAQNSHLIWVLGGDKNPLREEHSQVYRTLAEGIADGVNNVKKEDSGADFSTTMMTFHPQPHSHGGGSANYFHHDEWLDFNMIQTAHHRRNNERSYTDIEAAYRLRPVKPILEAEPPYEDHGVGWDLAANGYFTDHDVRKAAYWSVFAGACGHVYGAHTVWQFASRERVFPKFRSSTRGWWNEEKDGLPPAKDLPGAFDMAHLKNLMLSRPYLSRVADRSMVQDAGPGARHVQATHDANGDYAFIYVPTGIQSVQAKTSKLSGEYLNAWWYNPRDGKTYDAEGTETDTPFAAFARPAGGQYREFQPPGGSAAEDWVLLLDNKAKNFPKPGNAVYVKGN